MDARMDTRWKTHVALSAAMLICIVVTLIGLYAVPFNLRAALPFAFLPVALYVITALVVLSFVAGLVAALTRNMTSGNTVLLIGNLALLPFPFFMFSSSGDVSFLLYGIFVSIGLGTIVLFIGCLMSISQWRAASP